MEFQLRTKADLGAFDGAEVESPRAKYAREHRETSKHHIDVESSGTRTRMLRVSSADLQRKVGESRGRLFSASP